MTRLDAKLARTLAGRCGHGDFIIADAKDGDMGPSLTSTGPLRAPDGSAVKPVIRANDATDIRVMRGASCARQPSRPFRSASLKPGIVGTDLGLYSITFNNDLDADLRPQRGIKDDDTITEAVLKRG